MKQEVKAGQHDFRPNSPEQFTPVMGDFSLRLSLDLFPECWYDPTKFECNTSWNKGGGIGRYLSENNKDAILLAWRPTRNQNEFEAAIYRNDEAGDWEVQGFPLTFRVDETPVMIITRERRAKIEVELKIAQRPVGSVRYSTAMAGWMRKRGAWFGGRCPAPHDMMLFASWQKIKP